MSLIYNPTLPNPPDDPADDVSGMQTNAGSINTIWGIDHVSFAGPVAGTHKQVQFSLNNVPSLPTTFPTLFTNIVNAVPQLFFYSGNASQTSSQYQRGVGSFSTGGSTFLFGGIILKWGQCNVSGAQDISFATECGSAFPNNGFVTIAQPINSNGAGVANDYNYVYNVTASSFACRAVQRTSLTTNSDRIFFIAIGN